MFAAKNLLLAGKAASGGGGGGTVLYDSKGASSNGVVGAGTPFTWTHTVVTAGATIYADIMCDSASSLSPVTCDGSAMTLVGTVTFTTGAIGDAFLSRYKYVGASAGAHTISVTASAAAWVAYGSVAYTGVASEGSLQSALGTGASASYSPTWSAGQVILQAFGGYYAGPNMTAGTASGGTNRFNTNNFYVSLAVSDASASTTFGWNETNMGNWGAMAHALIPA